MEFKRNEKGRGPGEANRQEGKKKPKLEEKKSILMVIM